MYVKLDLLLYLTDPKGAILLTSGKLVDRGSVPDINIQGTGRLAALARKLANPKTFCTP